MKRNTRDTFPNTVLPPVQPLTAIEKMNLEFAAMPPEEDSDDDDSISDWAKEKDPVLEAVKWARLRNPEPGKEQTYAMNDAAFWAAHPDPKCKGCSRSVLAGQISKDGYCEKCEKKTFPERFFPCPGCRQPYSIYDTFWCARCHCSFLEQFPHKQWYEPKNTEEENLCFLFYSDWQKRTCQSGKKGQDVFNATDTTNKPTEGFSFYIGKGQWKKLPYIPAIAPGAIFLEEADAAYIQLEKKILDLKMKSKLTPQGFTTQAVDVKVEPLDISSKTPRDDLIIANPPSVVFEMAYNTCSDMFGQVITTDKPYWASRLPKPKPSKEQIHAMLFEAENDVPRKKNSIARLE